MSVWGIYSSGKEGKEAEAEVQLQWKLTGSLCWLHWKFWRGNKPSSFSWVDTRWPGFHNPGFVSCWLKAAQEESVTLTRQLFSAEVITREDWERRGCVPAVLPAVGNKVLCSWRGILVAHGSTYTSFGSTNGFLLLAFFFYMFRNNLQKIRNPKCLWPMRVIMYSWNLDMPISRLSVTWYNEYL